MSENTLRIEDVGREGTEQDTFPVTVAFPNGNKYKVPVKNPFAGDGDVDGDPGARLHWYFDRYVEFPIIQKEKAARAEKSIEDYGESLYEQLFSDRKAYADWMELTSGTRPVRIVLDSLNADFHALHWEALKDPDRREPYCRKGMEFIHTSGHSTAMPKPEPSARLNLLMVTARPGGADDIGYRTVTRPVLETIAKKRMPVHVHLLRPPTFDNLKNHLLERKGFYHILHLDVHGDVLTYDQYKEALSEEPARPGPGPYDGTRSYVCLETPGGGSDWVWADELGELPADAHLPVCILNACRSARATVKVPAPGQKDEKTEPGKTGPEPGARQLGESLSMRLLHKGARLVLGMASSLLNTAAEILVPEFYNRLANGEDIGRALAAARRALADNPVRMKHPGLTLRLQDWLLPRVWGKGDFRLELQKETSEQRFEFIAQSGEQKTQLAQVKGEGQFGFVGRDVDILEIERLLHRHNVLLIRGMGGTGKTTLLGHMANWWFKTGWLDRLFYFSYDRKPVTASEILNTMAEALMEPGDLGHFTALPEVETKALALAHLLKEGKDTPRALLVLDNLESVTGVEKAVGSRLSKKEQGALKQVLTVLADSSLKVLLGSRSAEQWLSGGTFGDRVYILEGLDRWARLELANRIMGKRGLEESAEMSRLMDLLSGYPLAMEIILPNLAVHPAGVMLEMLTGAGVDLAQGGGEISEAIFRCIEISYRLLSPAAREALPAFAPFTAFLNAALLEDYYKFLSETGQFPDLALEGLKDALSQAEKQGLLKEVFPGHYEVQPVLPFFLGRGVASEWPEAKRAALHRAFSTYMSGLGEQYTGLMMSKEAEQRKLGLFLFTRDRENLYTALHRVLDDRGDFYPLCDTFVAFYLQHKAPGEAVELLEGAVQKIARYPDREDKTYLGKHAAVTGNLGTQYMAVKNYSKARECLTASVDLFQRSGNKQLAGASFHQLGVVAEELRDFEEARRYYREALKIYREFDDRYSQAMTYHQLGRVAEELRDFEEARGHYREALKIKQEFDDRYSQASTYHQLGMVAEALRDFEEARRHYREALKIKQEFDDRYRQASTYHQLGVVAQELRDFEEARRHYREALKIFQEFDDRYRQASTYHQLGLLAMAENHRGDALNHLATALEIFGQFKDEYHLKITIGNLTRLFSTYPPEEAGKDAEALGVTEETKEMLREILGAAGEEKKKEGRKVGG